MLDTSGAEAGFSLLELMVCLVIASILTALALPSYHHYVRRAYYLELVQAAMPYKLGVSACFQRHADLKMCYGGMGGVPPDRHDVSEGIAMISTKRGQITIIPVPSHGIESEDCYVLTPQQRGHTLIWHASGRGVTLGYAR